MEKKILIFSHNFIKYNWRPIVEDQFDILHRSGLYNRAERICYGCYAEDKDELYSFLEVVRKNDPNNKIQVIIHPSNDNERGTLILLQEVVSHYDEEVFVLYSHTKGVSSKHIHPDMDIKEDYILSWRKIMEYFTKERWEDAIKNLEENDAVGCFYDYWKGAYFSFSYFSGNFWWSKSSHIKTLSDIKKNPDNWMSCELFISTRPDGKYFSLYELEPPGDMYLRYFDPKDYRDDL
jgi:hypothetical protein